MKKTRRAEPREQTSIGTPVEVGAGTRADDGQNGQPSPLGNRIGADMIDGFLLLLVAWAPLLVLDGTSGTPSRWVGLSAALAYGVYEVVGVAVWGKTLGRRLMGVAVRRPDGGPAGWWPSIVRWSVLTLTPVSLLVYPLGNDRGFNQLITAVQLVVIASILLDRRRRGLHDKAAGTMVVVERQVASSSAR